MAVPGIWRIAFGGTISLPRFWRYNVEVPAAAPKRQPEQAPPEHHRVPQVYTLEATGLLVIAILILVLTLIRYWHHIPWNPR